MSCDERRYPGGALYARIQLAKREYFYEDGTLKTVIHYAEGELDGEVILYWPNGMVKRKCCFEKGRRVEDQIWDEEGKKDVL